MVRLLRLSKIALGALLKVLQVYDRVESTAYFLQNPTADKKLFANHQR